MDERQIGKERRQLPVFDCCLVRQSIKLKPGEYITIWGPDMEFGEGAFMFRDRRNLKDRRNSKEIKETDEETQGLDNQIKTQ